MLLRHCSGAQTVWRVVQVPRVTDEDRRHLQRAREEMKAERPQHSQRLKGRLASGGLAVWEGGEACPTVLAGGRLWDGQAVPAALHQRLVRECARRPCV